MVQQDHEPRQILVLGTQSVTHPAPYAGKPLPQEPGIHLQQPTAMGEAVGIHRPNDRQMIDHPRHLGKHVADRQTALSGGSENPAASQQRTRVAHFEQWIGVEVGDRLTVETSQFGLRVECIDLADPTVHE